MLNEAPKKQKKQVDYSHPTPWQLFWRIQRESWRRMVTPYLMYFFMSLLMLAAQAIPSAWAQIVLGVLCILGGAFYNGHLCYQFGKIHYGALLAGELHRKHEAAGVLVGNDHHVEQEYRPWKGFYIGFLVGVPVIILGCVAGALFTGKTIVGSYAALALIMFAGWAIIPFSWFGDLYGGNGVSLYWSVAAILLPILVSGIFYIVGAYVEKRSRLAETERERRMEEARERAKNEVRIQTEEQRKKTLQSKKKK